jgi:hypothetical protein
MCRRDRAWYGNGTGMNNRTSTITVKFTHPFVLDGVDRELPPGDYRVTTDEELIEGLSFPVYRRVSTTITVPVGRSLASIEVVRIDPRDLQAARKKDAAI